MKLFSTALVILASASQALAHYRFNKLIANGVVQPDFKYIRQWTPIYSNSPVMDLSSPDLRCNFGASPAADTIKVPAGSMVGFGSDTPIMHPGPYMAYMAKAPGNVKNWDGNGRWFKIWQEGPTRFTQQGAKWDVNTTQWTFNIPRNTPSGQYLLRFEHIALHEAYDRGGAQFYMSCAQIEVTGGGNGRPQKTISFPGGYSLDDPALKINIYFPVMTKYTPPGPAVWRG